MKQYMLAVHTVDGAPQPSTEEMQTAFAQADRVNDELQCARAPGCSAVACCRRTPPPSSGCRTAPPP